MKVLPATAPTPATLEKVSESPSGSLANVEMSRDNVVPAVTYCGKGSIIRELCYYW